MHNKIVDQVYRRSTELEWGALRFNFRGVGKSPGAFDHGRGELQDLISICHHASSFAETKSCPWIFLGYSFGAWVLFQFLQSWEGSVHSALYVAPPVTWYPFQPQQKPSGYTQHVFAAEQDELIPLDQVEAWYGELAIPKSFHEIAGADHHFNGKTAQLTKLILGLIQKSSA